MSDIVREVRSTKAELADAIAARLVDVVTSAVAQRGVCHLVLTGGSMGSATLEALGRRGVTDLPWNQVHLWWGDERFLPAGDAERNETQARAALLDELDIPAENIHAVAASDGAFGDDLEAAAQAYAEELSGYATSPLGVPDVDVVMLGMGPDTHVASLFPGHASTQVEDVTVLAEHDSPKPPPQRVSLTFPALNAGREVWLMIAGADKQDAVAAASSSSDRTAHPASGVHGRETTIWWLDEAAAGQR